MIPRTSAALRLVHALGRSGAEVIEGPVERQGGRDGGTALGTSHYTRDPDANLLEFIGYWNFDSRLGDYCGNRS